MVTSIATAAGWRPRVREDLGTRRSIAAREQMSVLHMAASMRLVAAVALGSVVWGFIALGFA